ncbi:MAG TPA: radical SAM protein [Ilumatobacteraceae bacterium]|nr:radical SAM protein [Ilumatobacteraceae bacterium]
MRIQLVTPRNPPSFWTFDSILPLLGVDCIFPNLSMPTVAGLTPAGHEIILSDENLGPVPLDLDADVVGLTGYPIHKPRIEALAAQFRARGRLVAIGGPYASLYPAEAATIADVVFVGEAEHTWPTFLDDLARGTFRSRYEVAVKPDLTNAAIPRFDLVDARRFHAMTIQFSRGCPFRCEFCDIIVVYGRKPRTKAVARVVAEVEACLAAGARQVFIVDDNFAANKRLTRDLLTELAAWGRERGYPIDFNAELSLDVAQDDELLRLLREANFTTVFVGIESPNPSALAEANKTQNTRQDIVRSVRRFHDFGIQVQAGMIVGFDADTTAIFEQQAEFAQQARIPIVMAGMLQAIEGTPLFDRIAAEGRLLSPSTGDQFNHSTIAPRNMTTDELYEGYRRLLAQLYDWRAYEERAVAFLLERGERVTSSRRVSRRDLRAMRSIAGLFVGRDGMRRARFSWHFLLRIARHRPSAIREAVSFILMHKAMYDYTQGLLKYLTPPRTGVPRPRPTVRVTHSSRPIVDREDVRSVSRTPTSTSASAERARRA